MSLLQLSEPTPNTPKSPVFFSLGFRPFFSAASISGALLILCWTLVYRGKISIAFGDPFSWHAHEMIYGYSLAIIAGFLLTAVRNWTGHETAKGWQLVGLLALWLGPRFLLISNEPSLWLSTLDLSFTPLLATCLAIPIIRSKNWRNLMFVPILVGFFICNLCYHLSIHGVIDLNASAPLKIAMELVLLMITIIGARVMPMFTRNGTGGVVKAQTPAYTPWLLLGLGILQLTANLIPTQYVIVQAIACLLFSGAIFVTWLRWQGLAVWKKPLVWILHIAYLGLALSFLLKACHLMQLSPESLWLHCAGVLTIGVMTLGFIGRVSLGHTGRPLECTKLMLCSYALMLLAACLRLSASIYPSPNLWDGAALCWAGALILFAWQFLPYLVQRRPDGKPG